MYPIHLFKARVDSARGLNTLIRAFDLEAGSTAFKAGMSIMSYYQPDTFSEKILGQRLSTATLRLNLKLRKIKWAMRNVALKEAADAEKTFRASQKNYEIVRK